MGELTPVLNYREISKKRLWAIDIVYLIELQRIEEWLENEIHTSLDSIAGTIGVEAQEEHHRVTSESAGWVKKIHNKFGERLSADKGSKLANPQIFRDAQTKVFEQSAPTSVKVFGAYVAVIIAVLIELIVFGAQIIFDGANPLLLIIAVGLAIAAWLAGHGAGSLISSNLYSKYNEEKRKATMKRDGITWLIPGIVATLGMVAFRAYQSESHFAAGFITLFLGIIVIGTEAFREHAVKAREYYIGKQFSSQQHYADLRHFDNMREGYWEEQCRRIIDGACRDLRPSISSENISNKVVRSPD